MGKKTVVTEVQKLTAEPGDTLFVIYPLETPPNIVKYSLEMIQKAAPKGVNVIGKPNNWKVVHCVGPENPDIDNPKLEF